MDRDRDKDWLKCAWDGDQSTFGDYIRRVRLAFAKTPQKKRKFLGPELVSQLTGRAWVVTQEVAHDRLVQADGAKYLVEFLESRLARVPVPDAGSRARRSSSEDEEGTRHVNVDLVPQCSRGLQKASACFEASSPGAGTFTLVFAFALSAFQDSFEDLPLIDEDPITNYVTYQVFIRQAPMAERFQVHCA